MQRIIEETADGVATLYNPEMDEHYHSVKGALTEAQHVYIDSALAHSSASPIQLLEVGFGTGLNAFLSLLAAQKGGKRTHYTTLELYPLPLDTIAALGYAEAIAPEAKELFLALHKAEWNIPVEITPYFLLEKRQVDLRAYLPERGIDVIYFDAFAPEKQPELWSEEVFKTLYQATNQGGILSTYCAKGCIRRLLQSVGYTVERLAGPPNGKREILRATRVTL